MDDRDKATALRATYALRRAAVLSYEQLAAATEPSRVKANPPVEMRSPAVRYEAPPQFSAAELARDPVAHPVAPARPPRAAKPFFVVEELSDEELLRPAAVPASRVATKREAPTAKKPEALVIEPVEPEPEPRHRGSLHGVMDNLMRSRLSPMQRAAMKREPSLLECNEQPTGVTYTVDAPTRI